jgi:hypothetical protein
VRPRVQTDLLVGALIRRAEAEGGFAAVLHKGDPGAGSVLVLLRARGAEPILYERLLEADGEYRWAATPSGSAGVDDLVARRRRFDPDLWVVELDVPSEERFAAEMNGLC